VAGEIAAPRGQREDEMMDLLMDAMESIPDENPHNAGKMVVALIETWQSGSALRDADYLSVALAMSMPQARDEMWKTLTTARAQACLPFWKEVLCRTPSSLRTPVLAVAGMVAWMSGEGAMMNICLEEAERADGDYPLVVTLGLISRGCVHPDFWASIRDQVASLELDVDKVPAK